MKLVRNKRPLPRCFTSHSSGKWIVAEADIRPHPKGRLFAKLVVFRNPTALQRFWKSALGNSLGRSCLGAVNGLFRTCERYDKDKCISAKLECDGRYFCIIGLSQGNLSMEIISHEAVHAGFCYEKRVQRNLFGKAASFDEERLAYPAGRIAAVINKFLYDRDLYESKPCLQS